MQMNDARALLHSLIGLPIWAVRRSHGSYFLAEFGAVKGSQTFPARDLGNGRSTPARCIAEGEWSLLVENCAWRIEIPTDMTSHRDENHLHMQGVMNQLERQIVTSVALEETAFALVFSGGGIMRLGPAEPIEPQEIESQWMLTLRDGRHLTRDTTGNLRLE